MLKREDVESEDIQKLTKDLQVEVLQPAVAFSAVLRKRYTPILMGTPMTVDSAIRQWAKSLHSRGRPSAALEIVVVPELRKVDLEADPERKQYQTIAEAQMYTLVDSSDDRVEDMQ